MTRDDVIVAIVVADKIRRELDDDCVGLWKVPWHIRRSLPSASDEVVRDIAEVVLGGLIGLGAVLGELDAESGTFVSWPPDGAVDSVMAAWRLLDRDPNIGEVAWLAGSWG